MPTLADPPHPASEPRLAGYRPALDGIRAVAVLAVIVYHTSSLLPAGFLGVDMFFVLSGYLISALLLQQHAVTGRISFGDFWARRARRLLPALFVLLVAVAIWTSSSAPVATLEARRSDMVSTLLYVANWHFIATDQSYFATLTGVSPLRHMWSLAIEEQFYLLWPLLLAAVFALPAVRRRPVRLLWPVVAGIAVSALWMAAQYDPANPSRAYFGTDTRVHALLVGCALAMLVRSRPQLLHGPQAWAAATRAWPPIVALLVVALLTYDDQGAFYYRGGAVLFALLVAAALWSVEAAPRSLPATLLSTAPLRWIGIISYGLYLWHWPIGVWIGKPGAGGDPWATQLLEIGLTFAAATLSFYLVEQPVRRQRMPWVGASKRRLVVVTLVGFELIWFVALMSTLITSSNSAVARGINDQGDTSCPSGSPTVAVPQAYYWCEWTQRARPDAPVIATLGDSTARALDSGLKAYAARRGWGYTMAAQGGCSFVALPLPGSTDPVEVARKRACVPAVQRIVAAVSARHPDVWLIADRVLVSAPLILPDSRVLAAGSAERAARLVRAMRALFERLTADGAQVVVVATPPQGESADCVLRERTSACDNPVFSTREPMTAALNRAYAKAVAGLAPRVRLVSVTDVLCPRGRCPAVVGGLLARYDQIHYTRTFSRRLVPVIFQRARAAGTRFERRG